MILYSPSCNAKLNWTYDNDDSLLIFDEDEEVEAIRKKVSRRLAIEDSSDDDEVTIVRAVSYGSPEEKSMTFSESDNNIHQSISIKTGASVKQNRKGCTISRAYNRNQLQASLWTDSDDSDFELGINTMRKAPKRASVSSNRTGPGTVECVEPIILDSSDEEPADVEREVQARPERRVEEVINLCSP